MNATTSGINSLIEEQDRLRSRALAMAPTLTEETLSEWEQLVEEVAVLEERIRGRGAR